MTAHIPFLKLPANTKGVDYVVGDIHGAFDVLQLALTLANFNPEIDRLFLVGDLVDRGSYSRLARHLLKHPSVFAVIGNHEAIYLELFADGQPNLASWQFHVERNGLGWTLEQTEQERSEFCEEFLKLPYAIEIESARGSVGLIHAEVPLGMSWQDFEAGINAYDKATITSATWGRKRITANDTSGVRGIDRLFCGHTIQSRARRLGNIYYIDTAAMLRNLNDIDGHLTMVNILCETKVISDGKHAEAVKNLGVSLFDSPTDSPFGKYSQ